MTFWKDPSFTALQQEWYQRLRDGGFEDAEELVAGEPRLKQHAVQVYRGTTDITRQAKVEYFCVLAELVGAHTFRNPVHEFIMTRYADGMKIVRIVRELRRMGRRRCRNAVMFLIRRYEMRWGIRSYTRRELNLKDF